MSRLPITNDLPRTIIRGFKDESGAPIVFEEDALPIHLPLVMGFGEWGPHDRPVLCGGGGFNAIFGANTLDFTRPYANHTAEIVNAVATTGLIFYRRLLAPGAARSIVRLSVESVADTIQQYVRNSDGSIRLDNTGNPTPITGQSVAGRVLRWRLDPITEAQFGQGNESDGDLLSSTDEESTRYPIMDIPARFLGSRGNNIGFRLQAPTLRSNTAVNGEEVSDTGSFLYRFFAVSRADELSTSTVTATNQGEQYLEFSFKKKSISPTTRRNYFVDDVLREGYEYRNPELFDGYGPFDNIHVYHNQVEAVLDDLYSVEAEYTDLDDKHMVNFFTAVGVEGNPYHAIKVNGVTEDGLLFTENSNHFLSGGSDGDTTEEVLDELVEAELDSFESGTVPYMDSAAYPFSCFYDSGFGMRVKRKLPAFYARRDMYFVAGTQVAGKHLNTPSDDSSIGASLRALYRSVPESEHFGTAACRALVFAHGGKLIGSGYDGYLPFTIAFARKSALYMGSSTGSMNPDYRFSSAPGNVITDFIDHNVIFRPESARSEDWKNGMIFAQSFGMDSIFWPALQTIHPVKTSILSSAMNMIVACNLVRVGERAWRWFVGDDYREDPEFLRDVRNYVTEETNGRYDDRGVVTPRPYFTAMDSLLGYAWTLDIDWSGSPQRRVETLNIITKRLGSTAEDTSEE